MRARFRLGAPSVLALVAGLLLTALMVRAVYGVEEARQRAAFSAAALDRVEAVEEALDGTVDALGTVTRLFATMQPVSREEFDAFTRPLLARHPQIELVRWERIVSDGERDAFEAARRREFSGYRFRELADGALVPAARRPRYRVVDYVVPLAGNERVLGMDVATRPELAAAAQRACASGEAAMSPQFGTMIENAARPGIVILMPVYPRGTVVVPGDSQCQQVLGYTSVVFSSRKLMQHSLSAHSFERRHTGPVRLYSAGAPDPARLVSVEAEADAAEPPLLNDLPPPVGRRITVAGQTWYVEVDSPPLQLLNDHLGSLLTLAGGLLGSLGAAAVAGMLSARARTVRAMVGERTAQLLRANQGLQLRQQAIDACVNSIVIARAQEPDFPIEYVNPAFERLNGYSAEEAIGRSCAQLWGLDYAQHGVREILAKAREGRGSNALLRTTRKDGSQIWCEMYVAPCTDAVGRVHHYVVVQHDVTEKRRYEGELEYQATHDALTGLANRKLLRRRLREEIAASARAGQKVTVLFVDLDRFKVVNDSLGHRAGNAFLCAVADRLREAVREGDTVARLGGDEFVLVLPERAGAPSGGAAVERVMDAVARPLVVDGQQFQVNCCVGVANFPADGSDPDVLIDCADRAMYVAKQRGPNQFQYFLQAMNDAAHERLVLERALGGALARQQFQILYQPWADLRSGRIAGVQAQLRWQHPELGAIAPERFLPIAEESGASVPIGAWLLGQACSQLRAWRDAGHGELSIGLGVGMRQLKEAGLLATVEQVLGESGLPPQCLRLSLAESVVADDADQALPVLRALRTLGVQLAIDRFGTGHSSLADLRRLPVDVLQIDPSFVQDLAASPMAEAIPDAIISMAHSLGIRVMAAGVDTDSQCEFLSRNMCDEIQGGLLAPPVTAAEATALLARDTALPDRLLRLHKRERTLLLVDDEPNILAALKRQMRGAGCRVLTALSGQEGLAVLEREAVDVIVSDQRMPGMTGVEFLRAVKQSHPETVRLVLSGFTELQSVTDAVNEGAIYKFLTKPWDDSQLRGHIEEAFHHKEMADENRRLGLELRTANMELASANRQLEDALVLQREQIRRGGISLDIMHEALQRVPLAVVALDEDRQVAFANAAARELFGDNGNLLGSPAQELMPELLDEIGRAGQGVAVRTELNAKAYDVTAMAMGRGTRSRGTLIAFSPSVAEGTK